MDKDTMNSSRDMFVKLLKNWHPSFFAGIFVFLLYCTVDFSPESAVLLWIQQKTIILTPHVWQVALGASVVGIMLTRPDPRWMATLTFPAIALGGGILWYSFQHGIPLMIIVFAAVAYFAIIGVIVLSAALMKSLEDNARLMQAAELSEKGEHASSAAN